jgi:predicted exporter
MSERDLAGRMAAWQGQSRFFGAGVLLLLAVGALIVTLAFGRFESEILNLLPEENPAVEGLMIYNSRFAQARELAFFFQTPEDPDALEEFRDVFLDVLSRQDWVVRSIASPPQENGDGDALPAFTAPILLSLPAGEFRELLSGIDSGLLRKRWSDLAERVRTGSPLAALELRYDPLGLNAPALGALGDSVSFENTFALTSADGTAQVVSVVVRQEGLDADSCGQTMNHVRSFLEQLQSEFDRPIPEIHVTGRSAYVEQIRNSMRRDIIITSSVSLGGISLLFFLAFRSLWPLVGITTILATGSLLSLAASSLLLPSLNLVALAFCSILFGLGNDFGLLLLQKQRRFSSEGMGAIDSFAAAIRQKMPGIFAVALTTALGFGALSFSGSEGFSQLGLLTAAGIVLCAVLMPAFLFFFVPRTPSRPGQPWLSSRLCRPLLVHAPRVATVSGILLISLAILAILPWRPIQFDTTAGSIEPAHIPASRALRKILDAFPATFEPAMIILASSEEYGAVTSQAAALEPVLKVLQEQGEIAGFSSPLPLLGTPEIRGENQTAAAAFLNSDLEASLFEAAKAAGVDPQVALAGLSQLRGLADPEVADRTWNASLPEHSSWWFLVDRMVSPDGQAAIAYLNTPTIGAEVEQAILSAAPGAKITGWSQTLNDLVDWAKAELFFYGSVVTAVILLVLAAIYRNPMLWLVHAGALFLSLSATVTTFKLLQIPFGILNVLALPLILGVGVDYATHLLLTLRTRDPATQLPDIFKPVLLAGTTTLLGFGALSLAENPALSGLGITCLIGIAWSLFTALLLVFPLCGMIRPKPLT